MVGCLGTKKITESDTKTTEKVDISDVKTEKVEKSGAIRDDLTINVPESTSPEVTRELIDLMRRMNTSKSSGNNNYQFYYDEELRALKLRVQIAETQNREIDKIKETVIEKTFEESLNEYIKKIVVPWWAYGVILFLLRKEVFWLLKTLFPPLRTLSLFRPRTQKPT